MTTVMSPELQAGYAEPCHAAAHSVVDEQRLLVQYTPLVKRIVRQLHAQASVTMGREDMEQIGLLGLLDALRRYGPPDEKFGAFAALRVRGAILDELRREDWRPRTVRQQSHRLRDALRDLTRRLGREPTESEIAQALGLSPEEYLAYQQDENAEQLASFDELVHELVQVPSDHRSPEEQLVAKRSIEQALTVLDAREQRIVQLYYEFELSLKEIAAVLDLTEARVCQINKGALKKMKALLHGE